MLFTAEIPDSIIVHNVLKALPTDQYAIIRPMQEGIKIVTEHTGCTEIALYMPANMFSLYEIDPRADLVFKVHFKRLIDCLHMFGDDTNPSMKLTLDAQGGALCIILKHPEDNITIDCEMKTLNVDDYNEAFLEEECNVNSALFNAKHLVEALTDIDPISDDFELVIKKDEKLLEITTYSNLGESTILIDEQSAAVAVYGFTEDFRARYNFPVLRNVLKIMSLATKVRLSTGGTGLLGFNMIVPHKEERLIVEYYCTAQFQEEIDDIAAQ